MNKMSNEANYKITNKNSANGSTQTMEINSQQKYKSSTQVYLASA
jgi:hypothetical protein